MKKKILLYGVLWAPIVLLAVSVVWGELYFSQFSRIHDGATTREVQNIIGLPDSVTTNNAAECIIWHYNDPWPWRSSTVVCFGTNGVGKIYHP